MKKILKNLHALLRRKSSKKIKPVTKRATLKKRKTISKRKLIIKGGLAEDNDCAICFESLDDPNRENITLKTCNHTFHKDCMYNTCNAIKNHMDCACPLCRAPLTPEALSELGDFSTPNFVPSLGIMERENTLDTMAKFTEYVNLRLIFKKNSLDDLKRVLDIFVGTTNYPPDIIGKIMEFEIEYNNQRMTGMNLPRVLLENSSNLSRYKFIGLVETPPSKKNRERKKKYFEFVFNTEDGAEDIIDSVVQV